MSWTLEKIQQLINDSVEESLTLEYKESRALGGQPKWKAELTKDVSAFANASGGVVIYGVKEYAEKEMSHMPESIDSIDRNEFSKERLESILANIQPRIPDLEIFPITVSEKHGNCVYVVQVPQSRTAHQASDRRYYRRYNFESVPMYDYEIRDVMSRSQSPEIESSLKANLKVSTTQKVDSDEGPLIGTVAWTGLNRTSVFARHIGLEVRFPIVLKNQYLVFPDGQLDRTQDGRWFWRLCYSNHSSAPLFPFGSLRAVFECRWGNPLRSSHSKEPIRDTISSVVITVFVEGADPFVEEMPIESVDSYIDPRYDVRS